MSLDYPNVIPECFVDTNLMQYLLNGTVNHQHCCSKVIGTLKGKFADRFAIGIIDRDKVEMGYIKECDQIACTAHLLLYRHRTHAHYLITVAPAIDRFILDNAEAQGVNTLDYGLPSDLKGFTTEAKKVTSNKDSRFRELFVAIKSSAEIVALKKGLKYLLEKNYKAEPEVLKNYMSCLLKTF